MIVVSVCIFGSLCFALHGFAWLGLLASFVVCLSLGEEGARPGLCFFFLLLLMVW